MKIQWKQHPFDTFINERVSGKMAIDEILREAEDFFKTQYDDMYVCGLWSQSLEVVSSPVS